MALRIIHVGMGGWGRNWYQGVMRWYKGVKVVAWVDASPEALAEARKQSDDIRASACYPTLAAALKSVAADAVVITANLAGHVPVAAAALRAGLHVLVEKPFAPSEREARELVALAKRKRRVLMVSQNYRPFPAVRAVQRLVRERSLGPVTSVSVDFRKYANSAPREKSHRHYFIREPLWLDMSVHHLDLMRAVLGCEPTLVEARSTNPKWSKFAEPPAGSALIRFGKDILVNYRGSWISHDAPTPWGGEWSIECEKGVISWKSRGDSGADDQVTIRRTGGGAKPVKLQKLRYTDRGACLDAFVTAIRTGKEPETSGRDNIGTLRLVYAVIESAASGTSASLK
jgi:predicted dehydrogenase